MQFVEFSQAWDKYMADYEKTAFDLINQLKEKQRQEQVSLIDRIEAEYKFCASKDLVAMRKQEQIYFSVKEYDNAEGMRRRVHKQETYEYA
jgi:hypothetical protein